MKKRKRKIRIDRVFILVLPFLLIFFLFSGIYIPRDNGKKLAIKKTEDIVTKNHLTVKHPIFQLNNLIDNYLNEKKISKDNLAIYIYNFETTESYSLNPNKDFIAASTYKLPLAMYYYEKIWNGEMSSKSYISSASRDYEPGGATYNLPLGNSLDVATLLHRMVRDSDNTASKMLYRNIGGWYSYKEKIKKYSKHDLNSSFDTVSNVQTVQYLGDCLKYIYNNQEMFDVLIEDMYDAEPYNYLNLTINNIAAQKYGLYGSALNSAGIILEGSPYCIVVLTKLGGYGENIIGDINRICYEYFNKPNKWNVLVHQD